MLQGKIVLRRNQKGVSRTRSCHVLMLSTINKLVEDTPILIEIIAMFEVSKFVVEIDKNCTWKENWRVFNNFLKDTEVLYTLGTQNVLDLLCVNKTYTWDVKVQLMGLQREDVSKRIVEIYDLPITWEEYADMIQEQIEDLMTNCKLCPGNWTGRILLIFVFFLLFFSRFIISSCLTKPNRCKLNYYLLMLAAGTEHIYERIVG